MQMDAQTINRRSATDAIKAFALNKAVDLVAANPEKNLPRALDMVDALDRKDVLAGHRKAVRAVIDDPQNNWNQLMRSLWEDIDRDVLKTFIQNVIVEGSILGYPIQQEIAQRHGCNVPWAILLDPTSACNLRCTGCWAADYGKSMNLTFAELDNIIEQAKAMGTHVFLFSGGEPLVRKRDILMLCSRHPDCEFLAFTNGTLIDEEFADQMLRVKNFVPAISVEGFAAETDARRGEGAFDAVMRAMGLLRERKLLFGASCCYTSLNAEVIGSERYVDFLIGQGAKFAWLFTYMPVGVNASPELIATPAQRRFMYEQIRRFRTEKPLFTIDFWNDGDYIGGCVAGARAYCHINANGDVEPCAFIHYSDSNIREKTLLEAYKSPLFMAYKHGQPFNENHYRPCPLLDNEGALAEMVEGTQARSTDMESPEDVRELTGKCSHAARSWEPVADELWSLRCHGSCHMSGDGDDGMPHRLAGSGTAAVRPAHSTPCIIPSIESNN